MNGYKPKKEEITKFMNLYNEKHGHYPNIFEFDSDPTKPCSIKTIQRHYGGYINLKKQMGIVNPDARKGKARSNMASISMSKSIESENEFYNKLINKYGEINVHRWQKYKNEYLIRSDFGIYCMDKKHFFIDIFWASNHKNALNVVNLKVKKLPDGIADKVYFVCTNPEIDKVKFYDSIKFKKNKLPSNVECYEISDFNEKMAGGILRHPK